MARNPYIAVKNGFGNPVHSKRTNPKMFPTSVTAAIGMRVDLAFFPVVVVPEKMIAKTRGARVRAMDRTDVSECKGSSTPLSTHKTQKLAKHIAVAAVAQTILNKNKIFGFIIIKFGE